MLLKLALLSFLVILMLLPLTLDSSFGKSDDIIVIKSPMPAQIDGAWSTKTEWTDASETKIVENQLTAYLRAKHDETFLYILVDFISDQGLERSGDLAAVCFDTANNDGDAPLADDYCFYRITRAGEDMDGIIQGNGIGWTILQEAETWDPYDTKFDAAVAYSHMNDPYDNINKHVIYEFRIPIQDYFLQETMRFYVYVNDAYNNEFIEWPTDAGGKQFKSIVKDVLPSPSNWGNLYLKLDKESDERPKSPIIVSTDKTDYYTGETVRIEGHLPTVTDGHEVNVIVKDADGVTFTKLRIKPADNKFVASFQILAYDKLLPIGKWTINIGYSIWAAKMDINVLGEKKFVHPLTTSEPEVIAHTPIRDLMVGDEVFIVTEVKNNTPITNDFVYLVLIKDEFGLTAFLEWVEGFISSNESIQASELWIPEQSGKYQAEVFFWSNLNEPTPLSESRKSVQLRVTL